MIEVLDDVLELHNAILVDDAVRKLSWNYYYSSEPTKPNKHWHVLCGHNEGECVAAGYDWAHYIFKAAKRKLENFNNTLPLYQHLDYERIYCNAHTFGIEPHLHVDDGQFTMIYYPILDWKPEWGGGTLIKDKLVDYVGNRLVIFYADYPHKAMSISRECYDLRTNVVFKCHV